MATVLDLTYVLLCPRLDPDTDLIGQVRRPRPTEVEYEERPCGSSVSAKYAVGSVL